MARGAARRAEEGRRAPPPARARARTLTPVPRQVFLPDVLELFSALHANGVRIVAVERPKGVLVTVMKVGGGSSAGAAHLIPRSPPRIGVQMWSVMFLRDSLREVGFPCDAFV